MINKNFVLAVFFLLAPFGSGQMLKNIVVPPARGTSVSDAFPGGNQDPIAGNWTDVCTTSNMELTSNGVRSKSSVNCLAYWNANAFTAAQGGTIEIGNVAGAVGIGCYITSGDNGYMVIGGNGGTIFINKVTAGSAAGLTTRSYTYTAPYKLRVECTNAAGTTTIKLWTAPIGGACSGVSFVLGDCTWTSVPGGDATDSTSPFTTGSVGIAGYDLGGGTGDNWTGYDI